MITTDTRIRQSERDIGALEEFHPNPAYHCGRLLAICQHIQNLASDREVNVTYVDRFYTAASSRPAYALVPIFRRAQQRLKQIKANKARGDVEALLTRTHNAFQHFPRTLSLMDQGDFQLGYFHQRPGLPSHDLRRRLPTLSGHAVKSAGEKFIADVLYIANIDYDYEALVDVPGEGRSLEPDFTIKLSGDDRVLFIEYAGKTGDEDYDRQWNWKRSRYVKNFKARTIEDVRTDGHLDQYTLFEVLPDDLLGNAEGRAYILDGVHFLQGLAQRSGTPF